MSPLQAPSAVALLLLMLLMDNTVVVAFESPAAALTKELMDAFGEPQFVEALLDVADQGDAVNGDGRYDKHLCTAQLNTTLKAIVAGELWAIKMLDACGKIPSGILHGNHYELGDFDTCMQVHNNDANLHSQYCVAEFHPAKTNSGDVNLFTGFGAPHIQIKSLMVAFCLPATCSSAMLGRVLDVVALRLSLPLAASVNEKLCTRSPLADGGVPLSALEIVAIAVFGFIAAAMVASTLYDLYTTFYNKGVRQSSTLIAFSVYTNGQKLFQRQAANSASQLGCLNGVRVLSTIWVVFGHTFKSISIMPKINTMDIFDWVGTPFSMVLISSNLSVDTFFLLSGLLVSLSLLKSLDQRNGRLNLGSFYLHRYIRLTPPLAAAVLLCASLLGRLGDGPLWPEFQNAMETSCGPWWWSSLLYVQNYANPNQICMVNTWYLSVDMQLYLVAPALVWPMWRYRRVGGWLARRLWACAPLLLAVVSMAATFVTFMTNEYNGRKLKNLSDLNVRLVLPRMAHTYIDTQCRMGAWLVGIFLGYILHNQRGRHIRISMPWVIVGWTLSMATPIAIILTFYPMQSPHFAYSVLAGAVHESVKRVAWSAAVGWLVFACANGYGVPVNWFLSLDVWNPLSRLSYVMYIINLTLIVGIRAQMRVPVYFSDLSLLHAFWGDFGLTLTVAVVWKLAFESPALALKSVLLCGGDGGSAGSDRKGADARTGIVGGVADKNASIELGLNDITK